ncbi:MAG: GDP-mannose 4,6-dehydratase [bacterium JZ-2024 1]
MKVLITGITGFAGSHLAEYLLQLGDEVWGMVRRRSPLDHIYGILEKIHLVEGDLTDVRSLQYALSESQPEEVYHLAAQSYVPTSWRAPAETLYTNVLGEVNLLESIRQCCPSATVLIAGSSEEYGLVYPEELPIKETQPFRPLSPYGVSKVAQDLLGWQYAQSYGMRIVRARAFNHTGPRRGKMFASSNFALQLCKIKLGLQEPRVEAGNLDAIRDFSDVRDVVAAYVALLRKGKTGEVYNICSGKGYRIGEVLQMLVQTAEIKVEIVQKADRMRPSDVPVLIGDNTKIRTEIGWERKIPFEQTLRDLLVYWETELRKGSWKKAKL